MRDDLKWHDEKADNSTPSPNCGSGRRVKAIASSTSRRSLRSTSTQRRRWGIETTFSTSPTESASAASCVTIWQQRIARRSNKSDEADRIGVTQGIRSHGCTSCARLEIGLEKASRKDRK
jgi:hypothetical protein